MKSLHRLVLALPLAVAMLVAQNNPPPDSQDRKAGQADTTTRSFTGTILDSSCGAATQLSPVATDKNAREEAKKEALRQCQPSESTYSYALLTDDGTFYLLDETGNREVASKVTDKTEKNIKASVTGTVDGGSLKVQSFTRL